MVIKDAPYIIEAELIGYPEHPISNSEAASMLFESGEEMSIAIDYLCRAADLLEGSEHEKEADKLISQLEDLKCDIDTFREKIRGR